VFKFLGRLLLWPVKLLLWLFVRLLLVALRVLLIAVVILCIVLATGNLWVPRAVEMVLQRASGFPVAIGSSKGSLFKGRVDFRDCAVKNPSPPFKDEKFIAFNRLTGDVALTSLWRKTVVIEELTVDIDTVATVKNADGTDNYVLFGRKIHSLFAEDPDESDGGGTSNPGKARDGRGVLVKKLTLAIGTLRIVDEGRGTARDYAIGYRREFTNVDDLSKLRKQLIGDLAKHGISILADPSWTPLPTCRGPPSKG
jgi:uncharacterized protein involved in outer membrane biogenesis